MGLTLKALDGSAVERALDGEAPFTMGRGPENDWVLPDPQREVSKAHCRIECEGTDFILVDLSINGVTIEGEATPAGPGRRHRLQNGDVFAIGPYRFAVAAPDHDDDSTAASAMLPTNVADILGGATEGSEARVAAAVSGDASRWLGEIPTGAADASLHLPHGWDEPPSTGGTVLPADGDGPAGEFSSRSEHTPVLHDALRLPTAATSIPSDWLNQDGTALAPAIGTTASNPGSSAPARSTAAPATELRAVFAEAARLDPTALAAVPDGTLFRRLGELLRASVDALDTLEAAQAVAEHDCGLPNTADAGLWSDFFAANRDPALSLILDGDTSGALGRRVAALADRQRQLGRAVADAAATCEPLAPESVEDGVTGFHMGPLRKAAAWTLYLERHAALVPHNQKGFGFLLLLRTMFARLNSGPAS